MAKPTPLPPLSRDERVRDVAPVVLSLRIDDVRRYEALVEKELDPEAVHDMRVAARRLRAALGFFDLPRRHGRKVKQLQDALGGVRDVQVQSQALRKLKGDAGRSAVRLEQWLPARRKTLSKALGQWREKTVSHLEEIIHEVDSGRRLGGRHYRRQLPHRLKSLRRHIRACNENPDAPTAHRLRIAAKKLRYEAEIMDGFEPDARPILELLVPLQEALGTLHDLDVTLELLSDRRLVGAKRPTAVLSGLHKSRVRLVHASKRAAAPFLE